MNSGNLTAIGLTIAWWLLMRSARGGMEWIGRRSNWPLPDIVRKNSDAAVLRSTLVVNAILGIVYLLRLLVIWEIYPETVSAFRGMLAIGFGLKEIVSNFVSGLILLFERPVRVGDAIELEGHWATIKKLGPRSTLIRTYDNADIIVPNWTLSSRTMRLRIPVGVAYGSDIPLVIKTLKECATGHAGVTARPEPEVLFLRFGDSTLDFELRVWISSFTDRFSIPSQLHQQIDQRFREARITIAFPQQDLNLRSIDPSIQNPFAKPSA